MKWLLSLVLSSSGKYEGKLATSLSHYVIQSIGLALVTLLTLYWRRCRNSKPIVPSPVPTPVLDISDYKVSVIDTAEQCETYFKRLQDTTTFVGFDCEWVSDNQRNSLNSYYPVALLQLAFPNKECALVRLSKIGRLTESLQKILTDKRYVIKLCTTCTCCSDHKLWLQSHPKFLLHFLILIGVLM